MVSVAMVEAVMLDVVLVEDALIEDAMVNVAMVEHGEYSTPGSSSGQLQCLQWLKMQWIMSVSYTHLTLPTICSV